MLETVWIKHESLLNFKNNKTYYLDISLVVAEGERRKLVFNHDGKAPRIVACAIDTALVFIDDMFFLCQKKVAGNWINIMRSIARRKR